MIASLNLDDHLYAVFFRRHLGRFRQGKESSMETTATSAASQQETLTIRLRNLAIGALFALVLLVPKLLRVRRNERSWVFLRVLLGISGAALVVLPLSLWNSWLAAIAGLCMFLASILLPPAKPENQVDDKAREIGALVVVNGGEYPLEGAASVPVQLFAGVDNIWVLDSRLRPLLIIPTPEVSSVQAEEIGKRWVLRVRTKERLVEFYYRGIFAEHLARVAESTIHNVMRPALSVVPRSRAAGA